MSLVAAKSDPSLESTKTSFGLRAALACEKILWKVDGWLKVFVDFNCACRYQSILRSIGAVVVYYGNLD